jgi:hypothetical protein
MLNVKRALNHVFVASESPLRRLEPVQPLAAISKSNWNCRFGRRETFFFKEHLARTASRFHAEADNRKRKPPLKAKPGFQRAPT